MTNEVLANVVSKNSNANLWHKRLGHIGQGCLQTMIHKDTAIGNLDLVDIKSSQFCNSYNVVKIIWVVNFTMKNNKNKLTL